MTVAKLTEGLNLIEAGMTVPDNIDSDEQRVATTSKSLENSLCCYKELLREKKDKIVASNFIARFFHVLKDTNAVAEQ